MLRSDVSRLTDDPGEMQIFQQERLVVEITELMCKAMKESGVKRGQLAEMLNKSKGRITQILNGETNLTLRTVADVFTALGKTLMVSTEDRFVERQPLQCVGMVISMPQQERAKYDFETYAAGTSGNLQIAG
jgi:transcriptional regulator with XRE-family HTH domain